MSMLKTIATQAIQDSCGEFSSKRIIVFLAFVLMGIAFVSNLYWGFLVQQFMFEGMLFIVLGGLGLATFGENKLSGLLRRRPKAKSTKTTE